MAAPKISNTVAVTIDMRGFAEFGKALRDAPTFIRKTFKTKMKIIGDRVTAAAIAGVSPYSSSIPPTIRPAVSGMSVRVHAGSRDKPIAGLLDRGNKGEAGKGTFRHPVFGSFKKGRRRDWTWVDQPMHPFMSHAMEVTREANLDLIDLAMQEALDLIADASRAAV